MASKTLEQRRKKKTTLLHHGFFHKYSIPKEVEIRRNSSGMSLRPHRNVALSNRLNEVSSRSRQSSSKPSPSPRKPADLRQSSSCTSPSAASVRALASPRHQTSPSTPFATNGGPACQSPVTTVKARHGTPNDDHASKYARSSSTHLPKRSEKYTSTPRLESVTTSPQDYIALFKSGNMGADSPNPRKAPQNNEVYQQETQSLHGDSRESSSLSPPPTSSGLSESGRPSSGSRKRKRTPSVQELDFRRGSDASSHRSSHSMVSPSPTTRIGSQHAATAPSEYETTSSLSVLSQTPAPPSAPQRDRPQSATGIASASSLSVLSQTPAPPSASQPDKPGPTSGMASASSLSVLSQTPLPPDLALKKWAHHLGDSQSDEELDDSDVFEKEPSPQPIQSSASAYCAPDTDSDLEDLDVLMGTKKRDATPARSQSRGKSGAAVQIDKPYVPFKPVKREFQYSLAKLRREHKREETHRSRVGEIEANIEAAEAAEHQDVDHARHTALLKLAERGSDEEQNEKLRQTFQRQELLTHQLTWNFFRPDIPADHAHKHPALHLEHEGGIWPSFKEKLFSDQAFLSGFAADLLSAQRSVSADLIERLWKASIFEPRQELAQAYVSTLQAAASQVQDNINLTYFSGVLKEIGAKEEALALTGRLEPITQPVKEAPRALPEHLHRFLKSSRALVENLPKALIPSTLCLFLRLGIDRTVCESRQLLPELQSIIGVLVQASGAEQPLGSLSASVTSSIEQPVLQERLLSAIPDTLEHSFKQRLALSFFLGSPDPLSQPITDTRAMVNSIVDRVRSDPRFDLSNEAFDFRALTSSVHILDRAIGSGFGRPPLAPKEASAEEKKQNREDVKRSNNLISELTACINALYARVQDTGASHPLRTTAKSAIQDLVLRLDYSVRTKPPPRIDILGGASRNGRINFGVMPAKVNVEEEEAAGESTSIAAKDGQIEEAHDAGLALNSAKRVRMDSQTSAGAPAATAKQQAVGTPKSKLLRWSSGPLEQSPKPQQPSNHMRFKERKQKRGLKSPLSADPDA